MQTPGVHKERHLLISVNHPAIGFSMAGTIQQIQTFFVGISHFIMDSESEFAAAVIIVAAISKKRKRIRKKRLRSIWVKPWLGRRNDLGVDKTLLREFRLEDSNE